MANLTDLSTTISDLFDVLDVVITNVVDLMTGNLLVMVIVGLFIGLFVAIIASLILFIKNSLTSSIKMRK